MSKTSRNLEAELAKIGVTDLSRVTVQGRPLAEVFAEEDAKRPRSVVDQYKSKAERLYALELELQQQQGLILWWRYEPISMVVIEVPSKGKSAKVRYRPDFMVVMPDGTIEFREIKGYLRDDARKTFLAACQQYPWWKFTMLRRTKSGWETIL